MARKEPKRGAVIVISALLIVLALVVLAIPSILASAVPEADLGGASLGITIAGAVFLGIGVLQLARGLRMTR